MSRGTTKVTVAALRLCWAVLGAPTGKRLAPVIGELVPTLCRFEELKISEDTERALVAMSAAIMGRRLKADRAKMMMFKGRSHTKPGSLLKDAVPIRTWAQWDDAVPGFVERDLVGHEGGDYFSAQQELISRSATARKSPSSTTSRPPHRRAERHTAITDHDKTTLTEVYAGLNPAAIQRQIQAPTAELLTVTTSKAAARNRPAVAATGAGQVSTQHAAS